MAQLLGLADVGQHGPLDDNAILEALTRQPGKVDGGVDTDGCELAA